MAAERAHAALVESTIHRRELATGRAAWVVGSARAVSAVLTTPVTHGATDESTYSATVLLKRQPRPDEHQIGLGREDLPVEDEPDRPKPQAPAPDDGQDPDVVAMLELLRRHRQKRNEPGIER